MFNWRAYLNIEEVCEDQQIKGLCLNCSYTVQTVHTDIYNVAKTPNYKTKEKSLKPFRFFNVSFLYLQRLQSVHMEECWFSFLWASFLPWSFQNSTVRAPFVFSHACNLYNLNYSAAVKAKSPSFRYINDCFNIYVSVVRIKNHT